MARHRDEEEFIFKAYRICIKRYIIAGPMGLIKVLSMSLHEIKLIAYQSIAVASNFSAHRQKHRRCCNLQTLKNS